jgi:hypothetical protein
MYAAMMKSQTSTGEMRTIAVVPTTEDVRIFSRLGEGRGRAGAWMEGDVLIEEDELLVGQPVSLKTTPSEDRVINSTITPSMFLVKLGKEFTNDTVTAKSALEEFNALLEKAMTNPQSLAIYQKVMMQVITEFARPEVEEEQQVTIPLPVQPMMSEEAPMEIVTPMHTSTDAVLVIPEAKSYFSRVMPGNQSDVQVADYARKNQKTLLITGPAGTGKTSFTHYYAAINHLPYVVIEGSRQIDESKVHGRFFPTGVGNSVVWKDSQFLTAIQQPSVILINELSRMPAKAADLFLRVLNERELIIDQLNKVVKVHPDCLFVVDQNTGTGYAVTKQDIALVDRMQPKMEFDYDIDVERKFIKSESLLQFAHSIREAAKTTDQFTTPMSPRILMNFIDQAQQLSLGFAVYSLLNNFPKDDGEREAIKMRLDADIDAIAADLGVSLDSYSA